MDIQYMQKFNIVMLTYSYAEVSNLLQKLNPITLLILEFLALKWAICEKFHEYLYGSTPFEVYTDNNPLTYVLTTAKLDACGQRWVAKLANYNFTIQYRSGQSNVEADALSRISWPKVLDGTDTVDVENMDTHIVNAIITGA